ncbi:hypothetical protein Y032_0227g2832 [Ancylostoma ceylanicum]|uniref:Uncharacterized protein n=1 Tax=Ancylostoma ceylanicum TaxID=53326 RepID=A0A016SHN5_9BILA|nr:hypothetical protein Y032_0227g2832 [Ancylostoma ceylanicum]
MHIDRGPTRAATAPATRHLRSICAIRCVAAPQLTKTLEEHSRKAAGEFIPLDYPTTHSSTCSRIHQRCWGAGSHPTGSERSGIQANFCKFRNVFHKARQNSQGQIICPRSQEYASHTIHSEPPGRPQPFQERSQIPLLVSQKPLGDHGSHK